MWKALLIIIFLPCPGALRAQKLIERFLTADGKVYTRNQRDSLEKAGNFVGIKSARQSRDTMYTSIFFYDRKFLKTEEQKQFQDKPFPRFRGVTMEGDSIDTNTLRGKILFVYCLNLDGAQPDPDAAIQLNDLKDRFAADVMCISLWSSTETEIRSFLRDVKFDYTIVPDIGERFRELGMKSFPFIFIVDTTGMVKHVIVGTPVDLKTKPDGTLRVGEGEPFRILIFETYSKMLNDIVKRQK